MLITNLYLNTDRVLPDILSCTDENFYEFVETFLGSLHARILQYQHINSVLCFLVSEEPYDMLTVDIDDLELEKLTKEVLFD
ncbi:unnamed protein product [Rotaria sp. Silwood2]|nr:unnamed protein product [Rotaria sp. Silwood2]CAF4902829.1 unnamed protein product [Rotaria sp. Silwood2]